MSKTLGEMIEIQFRDSPDHPANSTILELFNKYIVEYLEFSDFELVKSEKIQSVQWIIF